EGEGDELELRDSRRAHRFRHGPEDAERLVGGVRGARDGHERRRRAAAAALDVRGDPARDLVDLAIGEAVHRRAHFLYFSTSPTYQQSTMARITESTGRLSVTVVCRAELPAAISTTSSGPAPTASAEP